MKQRTIIMVQQFDRPQRPLTRVMVPRRWAPNYASATEATLFLFEKVEKLNRWRRPRSRILLISDSTLCLTTVDSGEVRWYCPLENVETLYVSHQALCLGIAVKEDPRVNNSSSGNKNLFPSYPLDIILQVQHQNLLDTIVDVFATVYRCRMHQTLPLIGTKDVSSTVDLLTLRPDGLRDKQERVLLSDPCSRHIWCSSGNVHSALGCDNAGKSLAPRSIQSSVLNADSNELPGENVSQGKTDYDSFTKRNVYMRRLPPRPASKGDFSPKKSS